MSTDDAISIMNNSNLNEKVVCKKKMSECNSVEFNSVEKTYYQKNRDAILNRVKDYSQNHEERLSEKKQK